MAIREFICEEHGKFEVVMPMSELPDTYPCPTNTVLEDPDFVGAELADKQTCNKPSGRILSVPGLIII